MTCSKFKYKQDIASLPFTWLYKYYMEEESWEDYEQNSTSLYFALRSIAITFSGYLPDNERVTNQVWCDWQLKRFQQGMINVNPVLLETCGSRFKKFLSQGECNFTTSQRAGVFMVDPTYTKIAVKKCLMSNRYTVPKDHFETFSITARGVRSIFEYTTGLCSCHHLDTKNPITIQRGSSRHIMYFACCVPEDVSFSNLGRFHERYKFIEINKILPGGVHCDTGERFANVVTVSLEQIKTYCRRVDRPQISPKLSCELCEKKKEEQEERVKADGENKEGLEGENEEERQGEIHSILLVILDPTFTKILLCTNLDSRYGLIGIRTSKPPIDPERFINDLLRNRLDCRRHRVDMENIVENSKSYTMYFITNLLFTQHQDKKLKLFELDSITEEGLHSKVEMSFMVMFHLERIKQYCNYRKLKQVREEPDEERIPNSTVSAPLSNTVWHESEEERCKYGAILVDPTYTKIVLVRLGKSPKLNFPILGLTRGKSVTGEVAAVKAVEMHCGYDCRGKLKVDNTINIRVGITPHTLYFVTNVHEFTAFYPTKNEVHFYELSEITSLDVASLVFQCLPQIKMFCYKARS